MHAPAGGAGGHGAGRGRGVVHQGDDGAGLHGPAARPRSAVVAASATQGIGRLDRHGDGPSGAWRGRRRRRERPGRRPRSGSARPAAGAVGRRRPCRPWPRPVCGPPPDPDPRRRSGLASEASTWPNSSKMRSRASGGTPGPVSSMMKASFGRLSRPPARSMAMRTPPVSVNFTALPARLNRIWRRRPSSARTSGASGATDQTSDRPLSWARGLSSSATPRTSASRLDRLGVQLQLARVEPGVVQQVVDQAQQVLGRVPRRARHRRAGRRPGGCGPAGPACR